MKILNHSLFVLFILTLIGCTSKPKGVYVGDLSDGKRSGKGTVKYRNGDKYQGQFFQDKKHGQGTHTWRDGKKYVGEWKEGKIDGIGKMSYKDGTFFDGEWKRDYPLNGKGVYHGTYRGSKIKLEGEWVNGKMEGFGKWTFKGDELWWYYYEGDFKNNEFHGQGKMIANKKVTKDMIRDSRLAKLKGLTFIGEFKNAKLFNVKSFDDNGEQKNISVSNGIFSGM